MERGDGNGSGPMPEGANVSPGGQRGADGRSVQHDHWRFLIVAQVANFAILRRHLGIDRANRLAEDIVVLLQDLIVDSAVSIMGRDRIDIAFSAPNREALDIALRRIDARFEGAFMVDGEPYAVEMLFGASVCSIVQCDEVRLIDEAEHALADAREAREPVIRGIGEGEAVLDRASLARDLRAAIGKGELFLQYQPKAHLRSQRIASVEALVRWQHPVRGLVLPGDFISLAEESRDIVDLTVWTIQQVVKDQRLLAADGHDITVFINISGGLLSDARFVRRACALVQSSGVKIGFEITETAVIREPETAIAHLQAFADIGIVIAIDDYGAGLSSLAYLKQLPARELKIDKLFVTQLTSSNRDPLIVRSTIDLAHALEMEVVAEGVETAAAFALLSVMGCDVVQGYFISRPLGLPALIEFLERDHSDGFDRHRASLPNLAAAFRRA
ncbi:EAL domain-containing protein [Sphingomonas mollis]|uniref:EAL domain-containing protein n=1 Tax=Sphingomonas mollis TaxID=2795726 RepID=UPI001E35441E|nr:EAL domain-containing protein [Sphingomonas sp. BT553]